MNLSEELKARGFINQSTSDDLSTIFDQEKRVVYHGIDPSADSAHVGNMVVWVFLKHLIKNGHKVIFLVGGGTGMIGDPKPDAERVMVDQATITNRVNKIKSQAELFFGRDQVEFVDNYDWLGQLSLVEFLRDTGKHFTVNELIKKEAISKRLAGEVGLSYTEFAYPLLQAYDYLQLFKNKNCTLQIGGSDQWGNLVAGVDLVRRVEKETVYAVTMPLVIDKTTGKKFGKSEGNAVWLSSAKTSPYVFYQFWLNVSDDNVIDYLKLFTSISLSEIGRLESEVATNPSAREAQKILAKEITVMVHGEEVYESVKKVTECLFGSVLITDLNSKEIALLKADAPLVEIKNNTSLLEVLVLSGLAKSKREARTFIESGAVQVNRNKIQDIGYALSKENNGEMVHLSRGRKNVCLVSIS